MSEQPKDDAAKNDTGKPDPLDEVKEHLLGAYAGLRRYYDENVGEAVERFAQDVDDKVTESMDDLCDYMILFSSNLKKKIKDRRKAGKSGASGGTG